VHKTKNKIIKAAAKLFRKKGYAASSMQEIAAQIGIKSASLYNHIESKNEILETILMMVANEFVSEMSMIKQSKLSSIKKVEKLISLHVRLTMKYPDSMAMLIGEWAHLEDKPRKKYLKLRDSYERDFRKIIEGCIKEGDFHKVNVDLALFSILSTLRWTYSWYSKNSKISPLDLEADLYQTLIEGLQKK